MKKIYSFLMALTFVGSGFAVPLSPQEALQRATRSGVAPNRMMSGSGSLELVMSGKTSSGSAAYYVFSDESKTLFVSADDIARPLLGYSDKGDFDPSDMPPQLSWWLGTYADEIEYANNHQNLVDPQSPAKSPSAVVADSQPIAPMVATIWNQTSPFNNYCPMYQGERTVTGCVATSMAQVMKYFEWPLDEVSPISYEWKGQTLTSEATTLDWGNMIDSYNGSYTQDQASAVARLMQLAGYSVYMDYDIASNGGSGAVSMYIRNALVNHFGYDVATNYLIRDYYTAEEWEQLIYDNLANVGPVIYNGRGSAGGHSFVCDGYAANGTFHINWGWGGISDGYFFLSALNPGNLGTGGGAGGFNYNQGAVLGIQRPVSGSVAPEPQIGCNSSVKGSSNGRVLYVECPDGAIYNIGALEGEFTLGVRLTNLETGEVYDYPAATKVLQPGSGYSRYGLVIPASLPNGDYEVRPIYNVNSGEWKLVLFVEGLTDRFNINSSAAGITVDGEEAGEISLVSYDIYDGFKVGTQYNIDVNLSSTFDTDKDYSLDAILCTIEGNSYVIKQRLGSDTVTVPANSTASMNFTGTLGSNIEAGQYYLVFAQGTRVVAGYSVDVTADAEDEGEITLTSWDCPTGFLSGKPYVGHLTVQSTYNHDVDYSLDAYICIDKGNRFTIAAELGNVTVTVPANSEAVMTFSGNLPSMIPGTYMLVFAQNYNTRGAVEIEVTSEQGFLCNGLTIVGDGLKAGRESTVKASVSNTSYEQQSMDFILYLCMLNEDNQMMPVHSYGTQSATFGPESELELTFTSEIPKDLKEDDYYLVLAFDGGRILHYEKVDVDFTVGIEDLKEEVRSEYRYFNLNGVEIGASELEPGFYIRINGNKSEKILVR